MNFVDGVEGLVRKIELKYRLIIIFTLILGIVTITMVYYATKTMNRHITDTAQKKLLSDLATGEYILDASYPGDWAIVGDKLYKGNTLIEENYEVIDQIGNLTGDTVTVFRNDTRVTTNIVKDGQRMINTQVSDTVKQAILIEQKPLYLGLVDVVGELNETAYKPIKNKTGEVIGIFYVGVPATPYINMVSQFRNSMVWFLLGGLIIGTLGVYLLSYSVYAPLRRIYHGIECIAEGDLTNKVQASANDELGRLAQLVNTMLDRIFDLIGKSKNLTVSMNNSSQELLKTSEMSTELMEGMMRQAQDMSNNVVNQSDLTERSKITIDEMSTAISQMVNSTQEVSASIGAASERAQDGTQQIEKAIEQINVISEVSHSTSAIIGQLGVKSNEIGQIVEIITGIASQTNLLALNAAIEAARAGEQGKGFAVVADEVKKLAESSAEAANQIAQLIKEMQLEVGKAIDSMTEGTKEVDSGIRVISGAGDEFKQILQIIRLIKNEIEQTSAASEEMYTSAETAKEVIVDTAVLAQKNAVSSEKITEMAGEQMAGIEEINSSLDQLAILAHDLEESISFFKTETT